MTKKSLLFVALAVLQLMTVVAQVPAAAAQGTFGRNSVQILVRKTVAVTPDIPPAGLRLDTLPGGGRGVLLDGKPVPGTECCHTNIGYAVLDRQTLELETSGSVSADVGGIQQLSTIIDGYTASLDHLVVLNWGDFGEQIDAERNALDMLLQKIGAEKLTDSQRQQITHPAYPGDSVLRGSAVGVAGAPAGSAFVTLAMGDTFAGGGTGGGGMSGYLRLNGVIGKYDFVFTDHLDFDTETNQTATEVSPSQLTIKVGDKTFTQPNPGGGVSGFHFVYLDAWTLFNTFNEVYTTNAADGAEQRDEVQQLANLLKLAATHPSRPLVIVQAFGAPHGSDTAWDDVAKQIELLGGTRQVFNALNAVDPHALNGEDANRKGPYAFVGRANASAPRAEQSYSLNGLPGRLRGVLMRARDGGYEPMFAGPARSDGQTPVNTELIDVASQDPQPFPAFKDAKGAPVDPSHAQAVQNLLGGPEVTGLCSAAVPACDIRKSYYQNYNGSWSAIQGDLTNAEEKCSQPHPDFTADECEGIRAQLRDEVSKVAKVKEYFGPLGLKQPFGAASVAALADLGEISQEIRDAVQPPPGDNTTSNILTGIAAALKIGAAAPPPAAQITAGLSAAFVLGAYFTQPDGSPNLIGPQITTQASKLGVELADRYRQAGNNLDDLGRLIVSDYGKLTTVASKVDAQPGPGETDWRLGNVGQAQEALRLGGKRTIYERLVPLAYPVMYDLGPIGNAREWYCAGNILGTYDKSLFGEQPDSAQFVARFPGWTPTIAVAQVHAVGRLLSARIPPIPASIADLLFKAPDAGGIGLTKLEFYSTRNGFRYFPPDPSVGPDADFDGPNYAPTLHQYQGGYRISCSNIPDPPNNSED